MSNYELWMEEAKENPKLLKELNKLSEEEIKEAFSQDLSFGTGGIRGIMGIGTNRMNIYTLRKANAGFANYLIKRYKGDIARGVVISHDNRLNSREFAIDSARVLASYGIKTYMFDSLRTTPELSFSVRYKKAIGGIMITASHNPKEYNGYKIYDEDGCQYTLVEADKVIKEVDAIENIFKVETKEIDDLKRMGLYEILDETIDNAFIDNALSTEILNENKNIKVVYTPLHGTGAETATKILSKLNYEAYFVKEQMEHDSSFSTVALPNPEDPKAFKLSEELGKEVNADILVATDPDADRIGLGVLHNNEYHYLTGNQTGAILLYYRLSTLKELNKLPEEGYVYTTIVTSDLGEKVAKSFGMNVVKTLTGFKFIGEQAKLIENTNKKYMFGYEESYGYLINDSVRDKDSMQSMVAILEMANHYKSLNKTLVDVLDEVYKKYGFYYDFTRNTYYEGINGLKIMSNIMNHFRLNQYNEIASNKVLFIEDYELSIRYDLVSNTKEKLSLPKSNVIKYVFDNGWAVLRPSGTEPKLKIYYSIFSNSLEDAKLIASSIDSELFRISENNK